WIAEQARHHPEAVAVECGGVAWRYRELMQRVAAIASRLRSAGAGKEALVGIAMERSVDMVAGLLAILKTGAAYLPLDPDLPEARLRLLLEDAQPRIILADRAALARLPSSSAAILLSADTAASTVADDEPLLVEPDDLAPDDLAYVLY